MMKPFHRKLLDLLDETRANQTIMLFLEYLDQKRLGYIEKQDIIKYQTLPQTYQWIESRVKFIDELKKDLSDCVEKTCTEKDTCKKAVDGDEDFCLHCFRLKGEPYPDHFQTFANQASKEDDKK